MFKKRIGITQKVMHHPRYPEVMTCLDVSWFECLTAMDILPIPLPLLAPEDVAPLMSVLQLDGVILSGGNTLVDVADETDLPENLSPRRDAFEKALLDCSIEKGIPVLGICRGLQLINCYFGGQLTKVKGHAGTRHAVFVTKDGEETFANEVNSFHECALKSKHLGKNLVSLVEDAEGYVEALRHEKHPILAIMWHPERESQLQAADRNLIEGFFQ